jgi:hypothetical protein
VITITFVGNGRSANANIPDEQAPSLRSAISEIRNEIGARASGAHDFLKEDALVRALAALGSLAAALNHVVPEEDKDYE